MAQNDMNVANQGFPAFRADLNDQLQALVTNSSGATSPATTFPHQWWLDTSTTPNTLRQRNAANDAWIAVGLLNQSTNTFTPLNALLSNNPVYTGTLTGGTGVINIGSGQIFKDANGNVGIGTGASLPSGRLEVSETASGAATTLLRLRNAGTALDTEVRLLLSTNTGTSGGVASSGISSIGPITNSTELTFSTSNSGSFGERLRIESAGKIKAATGGGWVGTVSQNGLSSVIERGSNVNGDFVKFADGTMIAILTVFRGYTANTPVFRTTPVSFAGNAVVSPSVIPLNNFDYQHTAYLDNPTSAVFVSSQTESSSTGNSVILQVSGRWY